MYNNNDPLGNNKDNLNDFKKREKQIRREIITTICLIIVAIIAVVVIFVNWGDTIWGMVVNMGIIIGIISGIITICDKFCSNNKKGD